MKSITYNFVETTKKVIPIDMQRQQAPFSLQTVLKSGTSTYSVYYTTYNVYKMPPNTIQDAANNTDIWVPLDTAWIDASGNLNWATEGLPVAALLMDVTAIDGELEFTVLQQGML